MNDFYFSIKKSFSKITLLIKWSVAFLNEQIKSFTPNHELYIRQLLLAALMSALYFVSWFAKWIATQTVFFYQPSGAHNSQVLAWQLRGT